MILKIMIRLHEKACIIDMNHMRMKWYKQKRLPPYGWKSFDYTIK